MKILVIQITRMGDVLQTSPFIRVLKDKYPDSHITILVRRMGRTVAERIPEVDDVWLYEEDTTFQDLRSGDSDRLAKAYHRVDGQIQRLRDAQFNLVYNCTHSVASAMFVKMAEFPEIVGADYSDDWRLIIRGPWTNYFFTGVHAREYNDLNICDVSQFYEPPPRTHSGLRFEIRDDDRIESAAILQDHGIAPEDFVVSFQLGASDNNKRWSIANFATLATQLVREHGARIVLVGVDDEKEYGEAFEQILPGVATHLFGETTIPQLAALMERSKLLVTNDTGTMHIAAAANCPIVLVSVGYVHFRETGPYGAGHCAIEMRRPVIQGTRWSNKETPEELQAKPQQVFDVAQWLLNRQPEDPIEQWAHTPEWEDIHVYCSCFAPDGALQWCPTIRREPDDVDLVRLAYRVMWIDHLDGGAQETAERESIRAALSYFEPTSAARETLSAMAHVFTALANYGQEGLSACTELITILNENRNIKNAQALAANLSELDERIRVFSELHRFTRPLAVIARFAQDNLEGLDPLLLAQATQEIHQQLQDRAHLMTQKIERIESLWTYREVK
jgi:ADP-heptose:LPS heptosyltransferase